MKDAAWKAFGDEIARWGDAGRCVEFWWRDDDAAKMTPALEKLLTLAARHNVPLALAVVPELAEPDWIGQLTRNVALLQHGGDHRNRAAAGDKKTEFPEGEARDEQMARLLSARSRLSTLAADAKARALPVLVPPWNRFPAAQVLQLAAAGYTGLSKFGQRAAAYPAPGIEQVNTHIDIIDWRGGRGFVGEARALEQATRHLAARRECSNTLSDKKANNGADNALDDAVDDAMGTAEPTGWLTHHLVHDEAGWEFLDRLFETTRGNAAVQWRHAADIFSANNLS
jgi:hypothetical protein